MNVPARYCTGYYGGAWFEAYLGGHRYTFDARHNKPHIRRILMARERDATDVAVVTSFGPCMLASFTVFTQDVPSGAPANPTHLRARARSMHDFMPRDFAPHWRSSLQAQPQTHGSAQLDSFDAYVADGTIRLPSGFSLGKSKGTDMRTFIPIGAALAIIASSASAQNPPANSGPGNNAVNSPSTNNPVAPVEGRNSFTEGQARSRIEANGFADVSGLQKDDTGVWRGKAKKDGKAVDVALDFQGNVVAK